MRAKDECSSNLRALEGKRKCFSIFYDVKMSTKSNTESKFLSRFPWWNSVKFGRMVVNIALLSEFVFREIYKTSFFGSSKRHIFAKIEKTASATTTFFVFKIRFLLDKMCCEYFGRFHRRKFKKITKEAAKTTQNTFGWERKWRPRLWS